MSKMFQKNINMSWITFADVVHFNAIPNDVINLKTIYEFMTIYYYNILYLMHKKLTWGALRVAPTSFFAPRASMKVSFKGTIAYF